MKQPFTLTRRKGTLPQTGPAIPHQQLSQIAPAELQEQLWQRMSELGHVITGHSNISMHDTRALHLESSHAQGPRTAFMIGTEFAHLHGHHDGSLHMALPPNLVRQVVLLGWGEVHPIARSSPNPTLLMVFGPRNAQELEIVWQLVALSYNYARGINQTLA